LKFLIFSVAQGTAERDTALVRRRQRLQLACTGPYAHRSQQRERAWLTARGCLWSRDPLVCTGGRIN